jgi:excisionase family DNA binding protein
VDSDPGELLTLEQVAAELKVSREALYRWRRRGTGPPSIRLPGGAVRIRRSALTGWLRALQDKQETAA